MVFSALALFLMVADNRFKVAQPVRLAVATALRPLQWAAMQPVAWAQGGGHYFESLDQAQKEALLARAKLAAQSQRANQVDQLLLENQRLRQLLSLRERLNVTAKAAQVLYDAADPYSRKVIIDLGLASGISAGAPVIDDAGVLGQVTRVYPTVSEVTLVTDREQAIPVLNTRTGARGIAFGEASLFSGALELRFMSANADVQVGDMLSTSGVDGVYPPGLPVARVDKVERRSDSAFARIICSPVGRVAATGQVMVLGSGLAQTPARPEPEEPAALAGKKGGKK